MMKDSELTMRKDEEAMKEGQGGVQRARGLLFRALGQYDRVEKRGFRVISLRHNPESLSSHFRIRDPPEG